MKSILFPAIICSIALILSSCKNPAGQSSSRTFELSGVLDGGGEGMYIYLDRLDPDGIVHLDSTVIGKAGVFTFRTRGIFKGFYNLRLTRNNFATLILDSTEKINLKASSDNIGYTWTATGSPDSRRFKTLNRESLEFKNALDSLQSRAQTIATPLGANRHKLDSLNQALEAPFDSIRNMHQRFIIKFITDNLTSFSSLAAIRQLSPDVFLPYYALLDSALTSKYPTSLYSKHFHNQVSAYRRTAIGAAAPELRLPDANGKIINLSDLKGKTVLISFWSSASRASIASLPVLARIAKKFGKYNFCLLGVSFDRDKDAWLNAINQYKLTGINVCDTSGRNSGIFQLYNLPLLPYNIIISANGNILDKDIALQDLDDDVRQAVK